ncbi:UTP--glucose-1-phosphate uridylyltransferase-like [Lytechinus pictus]|uniref:UTP--glucose-1-phosphate uridylyltransferase-like n=1 Tax=Lytechinus pictus TaxID=7653 RepID=UPI0030BA1FAA
MKVVILAAGYGTRLQRDIGKDTTGDYAHLAGLPKPLVPIGSKPLISHWMKDLTEHGITGPILVVTNDFYKDHFESWALNWKCVHLISDSTTCNDDRIGAVACFQLAVKEGNIDDDVLVIGGDTLFYDDFSLSDFLAAFQKRKESHPGASMVVSNHVPCEEVVKRGILEVNDELKVTGFLEKPNLEDTNSRRACPCFYLFSKESLPHLDSFLSEPRPMKERDATGNFVKYLYSRMPVYVYDISGRFDVGSLEDYKVCHKHFLEKENR